MNFESYPSYNGTDLGLTYTKAKSILKVWSPAIDLMRVHLYESGHEGSPFETKDMNFDQETGVWSIELEGDFLNKFYTFQVLNQGRWLSESPDPYAKAVGVNGKRAMFVDLSQTNPEGWESDQRPILASFNDIILYELHVRDMSSHSSSGIQHQGKFLGLAEAGTTSEEGLTTGLDHFKEMGVTHVHLLPSFDFLARSVDEMNPMAKFNWGYDPHHYNVPEGSYATDPYDGNVRIREFKQMVKAFHDNGIRVIMDVVYNHTGETKESVFNLITPNYYYRFNHDGNFSNASACGNETASERPMVRKFMIESMKYWAEEYHIDGFRVDLMAIHDIETMNQVTDALQEIDPTIFVYGEGWTAGDSPLPFADRALKHHTPRLKSVAAFSDDIRDALKGSVFDHETRGFVSGKEGLEESIKFGIVASTEHPQIRYDSVNYSKAPWANQPAQTITYVSCHDNHTLYDRLMLSCKDASEAELKQMHRLASTIVLTSQGVPFLHAGVEFLRTKNGVENSYESPDSINQINWTRKKQHLDQVEFFQKLIQLRKTHPAFRMKTTKQIAKNLQFLETAPLFVGYIISDSSDSWKKIVVLLNGNKTSKTVKIPKGNWNVALEAAQINPSGLRKEKGGVFTVPPISAVILFEQ